MDGVSFKGYFLFYRRKRRGIEPQEIEVILDMGLIACLGVLVLATVVLPLLLVPKSVEEERKGDPTFWFGALYFSLIGAGFMLTEIALLQRFSIFWGHPVYSLGVLLFSMIAFT